jgi:hypothetical protein
MYFLNNGFCFHFFFYLFLKPYENKIGGFAGGGGGVRKFKIFKVDSPRDSFFRQSSTLQ